MNILASVGLTALVLVGLGGSLPLTRGVYVEVNTPCRGAPMSARSWFGGGYVLQAPHARCKAQGVAKDGPGDYTVRLNCRDSADPAMTFPLIDHVRIVSPTRYELDNRFGRFRSRWCRR